MGGGSDSSEEVKLRPNNLVFKMFFIYLIDNCGQCWGMPLGTGFISQRYGFGSGSFPFLMIVLSGEIMLAK
jgi:hypothetical protein